MSFRKTRKWLFLNTIRIVHHNTIQKQNSTIKEFNYKKCSNRNDRFCHNLDKSSSIFYMIPEIAFLLAMITILYAGVKYAR